MRGKNEPSEYDQEWLTKVGRALEAWVREKLIDDQILPEKIQYRLGMTSHGKRRGVKIFGETIPASLSGDGTTQVASPSTKMTRRS